MSPPPAKHARPPARTRRRERRAAADSSVGRRAARPVKGPCPSGPPAQPDDVLRKALVAAVHEVVLHPLGEAAGLGDAAGVSATSRMWIGAAPQHTPR